MHFKTAMKFGAAALLASTMLAGAVNAKTFRFSNDGDVNSMDPYARNETFLLTFMLNVYEPLVTRDPSLKLEGALATEWRQTGPRVWQFKLRPNVRFHDGTPFTADDVVFSYTRATTGGSNLKGYFASVAGIRKVDNLTVEFDMKSVDPIFPEKIANWGIMSKAWAEKNNATVAADLTKNEESFATRNANGTGPFVLRSREPDVRTVLAANPNWWGRPQHNLTEVVFTRVANDATRVAALLSGDTDFVYTVPPQDVARLKSAQNIKVMEGPELRTVYLGFNQLDESLKYGDAGGKNPFKDVRVRQAFNIAVDREAIKTRVMRGQSRPTTLMVGPGINGFTESLDTVPRVDVAAARKLMADAGFPNGFSVTLDCPNDRYVNDEAICQAVAGMLAQINVRVTVNAQTRARHFGKINSPAFDTSFFMLGWTPGTYDSHNVLENLIYTRGKAPGKGEYNIGGYSNARVDELSDLIGSETDQRRRQAMIEEAMKIHRDEYGHLPLHQQALVWAMRSNVEVKQLADNFFPLRYVNVR